MLSSSTWYKVPARPNGHLITESSPDEDTSFVVQSPEESVIRTRLNADQLHSGWLNDKLHENYTETPWSQYNLRWLPLLISQKETDLTPAGALTCTGGSMGIQAGIIMLELSGWVPTLK